jgi:4-amino-4-deoxy-L-arabinose transferase-like glycosyltransferase
MGTWWEKNKRIFFIILAIIVFLLVVVPWVLLYFYYRNKGQQIQIFPEFKVIDVKNTEEIDLKILDDGIKMGKDILNKIEGKK